MKKFTVPCIFGDQKSPFTIYIGEPKYDSHPIQNQADWLSKNRGGQVPPEIMESLSKLHALSKKNKVSFEELCVYALTAAQKQDNNTSTNDNTGGSVDNNAAFGG